jgi:Trypsin-like peptidase domain
MNNKPKMNSQITPAVVTVGGGRGFVVAGEGETKLIITAVHCLPDLPPAHRGRYLEEETYQALVGPLDEEPTVWVSCLFADHVADLAILGPPDNQELGEQSDAYNAFVEPIKPITIADTAKGRAFEKQGRSWLLSLDLQWYSAPYSVFGDGPLCWELGTKTEGGMSGSPIINDDGAAIGVLTLSAPSNPRLVRDLPGWLLRIAGFPPRRRLPLRSANRDRSSEPSSDWQSRVMRRYAPAGFKVRLLKSNPQG